MCQFAIAVYEGLQIDTCIANSLHSLFKRRSLHERRTDVGLCYARYRSHGIHNLVGKHTRQPLPRLHLATCKQAVYLATHFVESRLKVALTMKHTVVRQTKGEVAIAYCLAHQPYP